MLSMVAVDGVSLLGSSLGGTWRTTGMTGWTDSADMRRQRVSRVAQEGAWPSTGYRDGLPITVSGLATFPDPVTAKAAADTLRAVIGNSQGAFATTDSSGLRWALVELDGPVRISWAHELMFGWTVPLYAPDARKFGQAQFTTSPLEATSGTGWAWPVAYPISWGVAPGVTPGAVSLSNVGTAAYWPRLRIDGPVTHPVVQLVETGDWVRYGGTVLVGQWLDVVLDQRLVLLNGQVSRRKDVTSSGNWLAVPPGGGSIAWSADTADPAALLSVWSYDGAWS